jgi:hypothetical protein
VISGLSGANSQHSAVDEIPANLGSVRPLADSRPEVERRGRLFEAPDEQSPQRAHGSQDSQRSAGSRSNDFSTRARWEVGSGGFSAVGTAGLGRATSVTFGYVN